MKKMYCWRFGVDVPMLDEAEFETLYSLYARAVQNIKSRMRSSNAEMRDRIMSEQYRPFVEEYRRIVGQDWSGDPSHMIYHRISKYGPPCHNCGKPLRTPKAEHCAACGFDRKSPN